MRGKWLVASLLSALPAYRLGLAVTLLDLLPNLRLTFTLARMLHVVPLSSLMVERGTDRALPWSVGDASPSRLGGGAPSSVPCPQVLGAVPHKLMAVCAVRRVLELLPAGWAPRRRTALADRRVEQSLLRGVASVEALDLV
jgi:hypothetical protein